MVDNLPVNWVSTTLGEICYLITDGTHKTPNYVDAGIPFISIANIKPFRPINWEAYQRFITPDEHEELIQRCNPEREDVLFTRIGTLGVAKRIDVDTVFSIFVGLGLLKPVKRFVDSRYLEAWMNSPIIQKLSFEKATGTGRLTLALRESRKLPIHLAPLNEQKRIADKLDSLLAKVNTFQEHLNRVPQIIECFRQSVLTDAVSGRLTEEWRKEKNFSQRSLGDFVFHQLPLNWKLLPIEEVGQVKGGKRLPKGEKLVEYDTGFPYIKAGQLKEGTVIPEGQQFLLPSTQEKISRYIVDEGDVYITIVGAKIGDSGVIPKSYDKANLTENAAKICKLFGVQGNYLALWLRSPHAQEIITGLIKSGAQGKLALTRIKSIPVPLPPSKEQKEIVRRVEKLFIFADQLEERYQAGKDCVDLLTPSLLAKAFRGELIDQDPNDEPASLLLEHIKAEREAAKTKKPKRITQTRKPRKKMKRISILQALQEAREELSSEQLFLAVGFPPDAGSEQVEEFFVEIRDAMINQQIQKRRQNNTDWFSLINH